MTLPDFLEPSSALFLDFDGTLVDIAPQPEAVVVPAGLVQLLAGLQQLLGGALAVVSGRPIQQIDGFLAPLRLPVAGEHGAERRDSAGQTTLLPALPLQRVEEAAQALAREYPALRVETKRGSVALHFRQAPELEALCVSTLQAAVDDSPGLALLAGKMVAEAKPGHIGKGKAIEAFLREPPFEGRRPIFVGDDVTDEAGFTAVQAAGGIGFKVGEGSTAASHRLPHPAMLRRELEQALARLGARSAS
jgi:trehalose 6-phosphate phosphatase